MLDACLRAETEGDADVALEILDVDSPIEIDPVTAEHILYGSPSKNVAIVARRSRGGCHRGTPAGRRFCLRAK